MKGWVGYVLLALSLFVAIQGYGNTQVDPSTEAMARGAACELSPTCVVKGERPHAVRTDIIRRRYKWRTSMGTIVVTCKRQYLWAGHWHCEPKIGEAESM